MSHPQLLVVAHQPVSLCDQGSLRREEGSGSEKVRAAGMLPMSEGYSQGTERAGGGHAFRSARRGGGSSAELQLGCGLTVCGGTEAAIGEAVAVSECRAPKETAAVVDQEELLRIAREDAYRERKALEAKYRQGALAEDTTPEEVDTDIESDVSDEVDGEYSQMIDTMKAELFHTAVAHPATLLLGQDPVVDSNGEPLPVHADPNDSTITKVHHSPT